MQLSHYCEYFPDSIDPEVWMCSRKHSETPTDLVSSTYELSVHLSNILPESSVVQGSIVCFLLLVVVSGGVMVEKIMWKQLPEDHLFK